MLKCIKSIHHYTYQLLLFITERQNSNLRSFVAKCRKFGFTLFLRKVITRNSCREESYRFSLHWGDLPDISEGVLPDIPGRESDSSRTESTSVAHCMCTSLLFDFLQDWSVLYYICFVFKSFSPFIIAQSTLMSVLQCIYIQQSQRFVFTKVFAGPKCMSGLNKVGYVLAFPLDWKEQTRSLLDTSLLDV